MKGHIGGVCMSNMKTLLAGKNYTEVKVDKQFIKLHILRCPSLKRFKKANLTISAIIANPSLKCTCVSNVQ